MKKTILIVDDTASMREILRLMLTEAGYDVLMAVDGTEALTRLDGRTIDLIITDLNMPNMDGFELIRRIRASSDYNFAPILLFSTESAESKRKALEYGATGMIEKPVAKDQMIKSVKRLVRDN